MDGGYRLAVPLYCYGSAALLGSIIHIYNTHAACSSYAIATDIMIHEHAALVTNNDHAAAGQTDIQAGVDDDAYTLQIELSQ